jgi:uncharacterized protein YggT (Ycf19 family)
LGGVFPVELPGYREDVPAGHIGAEPKGRHALAKVLLAAVIFAGAILLFFLLLAITSSRADAALLPDVAEPVKQTAEPVVAPVQQVAQPVVAPVVQTAKPVVDTVNDTLRPIVNPITDVVPPLGELPMLDPQATPTTPLLPPLLPGGGGAPVELPVQVLDPFGNGRSNDALGSASTPALNASTPSLPATVATPTGDPAAPPANGGARSLLDRVTAPGSDAPAPAPFAPAPESPASPASPSGSRSSSGGDTSRSLELLVYALAATLAALQLPRGRRVPTFGAVKPRLAFVSLIERPG